LETQTAFGWHNYEDQSVATLHNNIEGFEAYRDIRVRWALSRMVEYPNLKHLHICRGWGKSLVNASLQQAAEVRPENGKD
jgi:hypothetical protein